MAEAFCLASGPSLTAADVELVRQWRMQDDTRKVFAVNNTAFTAHWADAAYAMDHKWWLTYGDQLREVFKGELYSLIPHQKIRYATPVHKLKNFSAFGNSGLGAVCLATVQGFSRIYLLGYDAQICAATGARHHHADHPKPLGNAYSVKRWAQDADTFNRHCKNIGVEVINCSRATAIKAFQRMELEQVIGARICLAA